MNIRPVYYIDGLFVYSINIVNSRSNNLAKGRGRCIINVVLASYMAWVIKEYSYTVFGS